MNLVFHIAFKVIAYLSVIQGDFRNIFLEQMTLFEYQYISLKLLLINRGE